MSPQHVTTKRIKPNTPVQEKTPFIVSASTSVDSPSSREQRDESFVGSLETLELGDDHVDSKNLSRRRTLFYAENNPEPETSHSDTGVQPFSDSEDGTDTCIVCGTFDNISKLRVLERGSGGKMNVTKLLYLLSITG